MTIGELQAIMRLKDEMTPAIRSAVNNARSALGDVAHATKGVNTSMGVMGSITKTALGTMGGFIGGAAIIRGAGAAFDFVKGAAIGMNATLEKSTLQFGTLMGDTQRAEKHVRDLFNFAKNTPFETGPIIEASRLMQTFGGDALNTMDNLTLLGDASAATGAPIEALGMWVGRLHASLQGGQPIGEATMRLMELGVITPQVRTQLEQLAEDAGGGQKAFEALQEHLKGFSGAMVAQANTWDGLMSSISDAINITLADALKPFFDTVKQGAQLLLQVLGSEGMQRVFANLKEKLGGAFGSDSQGLIKSLGGALLTFADVGIVAAQVVVGAWEFLKLAFAAVATGVLAGLELLVKGVSAYVSAVEGIPGIGGNVREAAAGLRDASLQLEGMRTSFAAQTAEAWEGVKGNGAFMQTLTATRGAIAGMRAELGKAKLLTTEHTTALGQHAQKQLASVALSKDAAKALKEEAAARQQLLEKLTGKELFADAQRIASVLKDLKGGLASLADDELGDLSEALNDAIAKYQRLGERAPADVLAIAIELDAMNTALSDSHQLVDALGQDFEKVNLVAPKSIFLDVKKFMEPLKAAVGHGVDWEEVTDAWGRVVQSVIQKTATARQQIAESFGQVFRSIPETLARAFEGGGGFTGALKSIGIQIADAIGQPLMKRLGEASVAIQAAVSAGATGAAALGGKVAGGLGASVGSLAGSIGGAALAATGFGKGLAAAGVMGKVALGAMTMGIGAAAVGVAILAKTFLGVSKEIKEARKLVADFQGELAKTLTAAQLKEAGGEQWKATVIAVRDAYKSMGRSAAEAEAIVKQLWNTDNPKAAAAAMQEIAKVLEQLEERGKEVNGTLGELFAAVEDEGGVMADSIRAGVEQLVAMGLVSEDNLAKFRALAGNTEIDWKKMKEAAARYNIELGALGPAFNASRIHADATQIWQDFKMLTRGGADVGGTLFGMREEISALVRESLRFGTALPAQFQDLVKELFRSGNLIDENGEALTDISQLQFGDPIVTQLEKITAKFDELIDKIINGLAPALGNLPRPDIRFPDMPDYGRPPGERVDPAGIQGFASGTLGTFGSVLHDFDRAGELVKVHGREAIMTEGQIADLVRGAGGLHDMRVRDLEVRLGVAEDVFTRTSSAIGDMVRDRDDREFDWVKFENAVAEGIRTGGARQGDMGITGAPKGEVVENTYLMPILMPRSDNPNDIAAEVMQQFPKRAGGNEGRVRTFIADIAREAARQEIERDAR